MPATTLPSPQQCLPGVAASWRLEPRRALTLRPREDGVLRIAGGRVWVTFDGPHAGRGNDLGDRVLAAGDSLPVRAGRRVVLESCDRGLPAWFQWDFEAPCAAAATARAQAWDELRLAAALGTRAAWRLVRALAWMPAPAASARAPA